MTDHDRDPDSDDTPRLQIDRPYSGETGTEERLALNRTGSFEWDLDTRSLDIDAAGLLVFGLDPEEFTPDPGILVSRLEPAERDRLELAIDEAITGGHSSYSVHFQVPRANGTHQWTHVQARILRRDDGRAHRVIGVVRDATQEVTHSAFVLDLEKRRQRQTSIVERTTSAMSRAVSVNDVTATLTGPSSLAMLGADGVALGLVENTSINVIAASGVAPESIIKFGSGNLDPRFPLADTVLSGRPRFVTSIAGLLRRYPALEPFTDELKFRAAAYLPLIAQARSLGGLALFYCERTDFNADERNLCLGLSAIVAQSLQRATLFDEEREFATGLQSAMLPRRIQEIEGGEIAVRYHAARSGRQVGGDWYDVIALPKNRFGIVVGDVEGHDTHAAAIMGQLRIALRAYAGEGHPCGDSAGPGLTLSRRTGHGPLRHLYIRPGRPPLGYRARGPRRALRSADPAHGRPGRHSADTGRSAPGALHRLRERGVPGDASRPGARRNPCLVHRWAGGKTGRRYRIGNLCADPRGEHGAYECVGAGRPFVRPALGALGRGGRCGAAGAPAQSGPGFAASAALAPVHPPGGSRRALRCPLHRASGPAGLEHGRSRRRCRTGHR